ncbi:uncharacterized protein LOC107800622 [Nicotiana tabacum]|uniref:Uncharacterized protein LOC107800622 n=1 Tax=Nicotiana tabacum TaxID=4097 RepID=A0A1S4ARW3_TOBAC|nr:PREDICTED: uncharacterized protein LOC107800622 [Nicotiana tabacum]
MGCLETKVKVKGVERVKRKLGTEWEIVTDYISTLNGRIWVCWKPSLVEVKILMTGSQIVHCQVKDKGSQFSCHTTFVYSFNTVSCRKKIWQHLRLINTTMTEPWIVLGDFNTILTTNDRINGALVQQAEMQDFQDCVEDIGLGQICRRGCKYSWSNKHVPEDRNYSLIDWAIGNQYWFNKYNSLVAHYYQQGCSDHFPILISTEVAKHTLPRPFRLFNVLLKQEAFAAATQSIWRQQVPGHIMYAICKKLKLLEIFVTQMNREVSKLDHRLEQLHGKLQAVQEKLEIDLYNPLLNKEEKKVLVTLEKWSDIHERVLRQKSRATW